MRTQMHDLNHIPQLLAEVTNAMRGATGWTKMQGIAEHPEMTAYTVVGGNWTFIALHATVDGLDVYDGTASDMSRFQILHLTPDLAKEGYELAVANQK
jgi:hypothetical protein